MYAPNYEKASYWIDEIEKEWNKYLIENEIEKEKYT